MEKSYQFRRQKPPPAPHLTSIKRAGWDIRTNLGKENKPVLKTEHPQKHAARVKTKPDEDTAYHRRDDRTRDDVGRVRPLRTADAERRARRPHGRHRRRDGVVGHLFPSRRPSSPITTWSGEPGTRGGEFLIKDTILGTGTRVSARGSVKLGLWC